MLASDLHDGSPIDRVFFFLLIVAAIYILWQRQFSWSLLFQNNVWSYSLPLLLSGQYPLV